MQCNNDAKLLWFNKVTNNKLQKCVHCTKIKVWFYFIKSPGVWYWFPANSIDITNWNSNLKFYFRLTAWKVSKYGVFPGPNAGKYGPEKTPYLGTFHAVTSSRITERLEFFQNWSSWYIFSIAKNIKETAIERTHSETTGRIYAPVLKSPAVDSDIKTEDRKVVAGFVQGPATDGSNDGAVSESVGTAPTYSTSFHRVAVVNSEVLDLVLRKAKLRKYHHHPSPSSWPLSGTNSLVPDSTETENRSNSPKKLSTKPKTEENKRELPKYGAHLR